MSTADCETKCDNDPKCVAIEAKINRECEIWCNTPNKAKVVMPKHAKDG